MNTNEKEASRNDELNEKKNKEEEKNYAKHRKKQYTPDTSLAYKLNANQPAQSSLNNDSGVRVLFLDEVLFLFSFFSIRSFIRSLLMYFFNIYSVLFRLQYLQFCSFIVLIFTIIISRPSEKHLQTVNTVKSIRIWQKAHNAIHVCSLSLSLCVYSYSFWVCIVKLLEHS